MTAGEKKRMLGIVRTVECFFSENLALKAALTSHRIPTQCGRRNAISLWTILNIRLKSP